MSNKESQLIGRAEELAALRDHLAAARAGRGRLVLLAGDAGVGKSRLLREFAASLTADPATTVLTGYCYPEEPAVPYGPFIELLRDLLRQAGMPVLSALAEAWRTSLARLLPELPALPASPADEPQFEKRRLFEALHQALRPPEGCRVVVVEDLHWADQTSQELLLYLARAVTADQVLLIGSYRPDELHRRHPLAGLLTDLTRDRLATELTLAPLSPGELAQLAAARSGRNLAPEVVHALYERTAGNPFFAEELLGDLFNPASGTAASAADHQAISLAGVPHTVKESVLRRTAGLDQATAAVLAAAAVIGRSFTFELLQALTGSAEDELLAVLAVLVELRLVVEEPGDGEDRYRFRHDLVRETLYDDLLRRERRLRHREVLQALERLYAGRLDSVVDQLAYHSYRAREFSNAARYAAHAGDRAVRLAAFREALAHYEIALETLESDDPLQRATLLDKLGHAAYPLGEVRRSARYWRSALALYEQAGAARHSANARRWLGKAAWDIGDSTTAFGETRAALAALADEPVCQELALTWSALSQLAMLTGNMADCIDWGRQALDLATQLGAAGIGVRAHALNNIGVALCRQGQTTAGIEQLEQSLHLALTADLQLDALRAYINLSNILTEGGQMTHAERLLTEGIALARHSGWSGWLPTLLHQQAWVCFNLGAWTKAERLLEQAAAQELFDVGVQPAEAAFLSGYLRLWQGRLQEAQTWLRRARAVLDPTRQPDLRSLIDAVLLKAVNEMGDQATAGLLAATLQTTLTDQRQPWLLPVLSLVEYYTIGGQYTTARELAAQLAADLPEQPIEVANYALICGYVALQDAPDAAAEHFARAVELFREYELLPATALAQRLHATALLQLGTAAAHATAHAELTAAQATLTQLGAHGELAQVTALLERLVEPAQRKLEPDHPPLTRREREVLALLARGLSNRAIAEQLVISEKTVETHVGNILGKLGLESRAQVAAYVAGQAR